MKRAAMLLSNVASVLTISAVVYTAFLFFTTSPQVQEVAFDAYRKEALSLIRADSTNFFTLSTALLAGLWAAVVVGKDNRVQLTDTPNIVLFALANGALCAALVLSLRYSRLLSELYWDMGPFLAKSGRFADVLRSPWVSLHYRLAAMYFFLGVILTAASIFSTSYLRRSQ